MTKPKQPTKPDASKEAAKSKTVASKRVQPPLKPHQEFLDKGGKHGGKPLMAKGRIFRHQGR